MSIDMLLISHLLIADPPMRVLVVDKTHKIYDLAVATGVEPVSLV